RAMVFIGAALVAFGSLEKRQHLPIAPPVGAQPLPVVEVCMLPTDVQQPVDGAGAAQHAAARPHDGAVAGGLLGFGGELPREPGVVDGAKVPDRQTQPEIAAAAARLDQEDTAAGVGAEPVGQHAACRARADNDVVVAPGPPGVAAHGAGVRRPSREYASAGASLSRMIFIISSCSRASIAASRNGCSCA